MYEGTGTIYFLTVLLNHTSIISNNTIWKVFLRDFLKFCKKNVGVFDDWGQKFRHTLNQTGYFFGC
jgi:hypothetical protein